jgi:hypothetical protein
MKEWLQFLTSRQAEPRPGNLGRRLSVITTKGKHRTIRYEAPSLISYSAVFR